MDRAITGIPGIENVHSCRDLSSFCQGTESDIAFPMNSVVLETRESLRARALVLNTFEDLEGSVLSQMRLHTVHSWCRVLPTHIIFGIPWIRRVGVASCGSFLLKVVDDMVNDLMAALTYKTVSSEFIGERQVISL
ncbi:7-deoxyloganetic acid glucosyltransferase [Glycine soja]